MRPERSTLDLVFVWVAFTMFAAAFALLGLIAWWLVYPYEGLTHVTQPFPVNPVVVKAGDALEYTVSYCTDGAVGQRITVARELEVQNHVKIYPVAAPIDYVVLSPCETRTLVVGVPAYAVPGVYHLMAHTRVTVNPVRTIPQTWVSATFKVVAQ